MTDELWMVLILSLTNLSIFSLQTLLYVRTIGLGSWCKKKHLFLLLPLLTALSVWAVLAAQFVIFPSLVLVLLYPVVCMGGTIKERLLFGVISCILLQFANLISISIVSYPLIWSMQQGIQPLVLLLIDALAVLVYGIMTLAILHFDSKGKKYLPAPYWNGILIAAGILFALVTLIFTWGLWFDEATRDILTFFTTVGLFILSLVLYFIFYFICKYFSLANQASLLAAQNEMIEKFLRQKQASDEQIKILSHDLKHSLIAWRRLAVENQDQAALSSIGEYEAQLAASALVDAGNESANAIINQKALEARQQKIDFVVDGFIHQDLTMEKLDFCALLGNLLDNALEAAVQVEDINLRRVKLSIKRQGNLLLLTVENGYLVEPVQENGLFLTRKEDKALHAIGQVSIRRVTEKYCGTLAHSFENHWFQTAVVLAGYANAY